MSWLSRGRHHQDGRASEVTVDTLQQRDYRARLERAGLLSPDLLTPDLLTHPDGTRMRRC